MTPLDMTIDYKVRSFQYLNSDFRYNSLSSTCTCHYLIVGTNVSQVQAYQRWTFGSLVAQQCSIGKAITYPSRVWSRSMSTWWKACLISFQIDLVPSQYHIGKKSKSSRYCVTISARSHIVVMGLLFILRTLAQVGAHPKKIENPPRKPSDVLLLGHFLRRPARASKPRWRSSPTRVRVCLGLQDQSIIKRTSRTHPNSVFNDPYMDGKIIW
jgi:hypothetical protein